MVVVDTLVVQIVVSINSVDIMYLFEYLLTYSFFNNLLDYTCGGGGGSFVHASATNVVKKVGHKGDGSVTIKFVN